MQAMPITVMTVDDHPVFLEGVASVLANDKEFNLVAEATCGRQAVEFYRLHLPDVTLMDIRLPDMNGIDAIAAIRTEFPHACVIVLTTYEGDTHALRAMRAGASGYMLKSMIRREMLTTIRNVFAGRFHLAPDVANSIARCLPANVPSPREIQVLELAALGHGNREIGEQLNISQDTVKVHMKNIMGKLQANDRTHAVTLALGRGIIDIPLRRSPYLK